MTANYIKHMHQVLLSKNTLKNTGMTKTAMTRLLSGLQWKLKIGNLICKKDYSSESLLNGLRPAMDQMAQEPEEGWLKYICDVTVAHMYPDNFQVDTSEERKHAAYFFLINYRNMLECERDENGFDPVNYIDFIPEDEASECISAKEYERLRKYWDNNFIFEFMRISREVTPFNTIGHIGGVHHVATFVGRQLINTDVPVDIALVSGAAAGHDLGKYGCTQQESRRIPYLHYYYTDDLLKREKMPMIAHIASNHSTWDLELENLSVESLLLIYADFRVKSSRINGEEVVFFYTLAEAFDVILGKLDNVDEAKKHRYERVYAKLKDFENYLISLGVETDINKHPGKQTGRKKKDFALMMENEVVENIKYTAIEHNVRIMSIFNNESAFGSLLEAARSEKQWKSQRAYLNILSEYYTYMTKHEKLLTLHFLYDLLSHREGDIRRQAGKLIGTIIAGYDDIYRKELPEGAEGVIKTEAGDIWKIYLDKIVSPDYKVTDQHRSWIGYTLKVVIQGMLEHTDDISIGKFMSEYFALFNADGMKDSEVFVLLDSVIAVPERVFTETDRIAVLKFAAAVSEHQSTEIRIGALRAAEYISGHGNANEAECSFIREIINNVRCDDMSISVSYLIRKILRNTKRLENSDEYVDIISRLDDRAAIDKVTPALLRENLKVGTPWVTKIINIEFLLDNVNNGKSDTQKFHLATHFSNLLKVSERVTVRHNAGRGLIRIVKTLPMEQINELVIELTKGLEIGEYQFSKYIPEYLGEMALYLEPGELNEFLVNLGELIESTNDRVGSVALDTVGEVLKKYSSYKYRNDETVEDYSNRKKKLLGMLLRGLATYHEVVSQEAFMVIGQYIFGSTELTQDEKFDIFRQIYKKMLTLISSIREYDMNFFTNAAALNHIYRFISEYDFNCGQMKLPVKRDIAFFPGTFDPFSLSHKGIVQAIRDEGFEVYLAIDEFSWSKKTQARMIRRQIISMSVADEADVFLFPDDFPVNIANPEDLRNLKSLFPEREIYMVVGSDVVINASSYKSEPQENSIHTMNHIVFRRETLEGGCKDDSVLRENYRRMSGKIRELQLPVYLEDISSTRIRENIDHGRDISNLIDPVAQNFIYDNSLYLREPQYKNVFEIKSISFEDLCRADSAILDDVREDMEASGIDVRTMKAYLDDPRVEMAVIRDSSGKVAAFAGVNQLETGQLYEEFKDAEIASYLRTKATGKMIIVRALYCAVKADMRNLIQIIMTEVLAQAAQNDVTYAIFHPIDRKPNHRINEVLSRQGFTEIVIEGRPQGVYEVNMKEPIAMIENMDTVLKAPFNTNARILDILEETHADMQKALTQLNPGNLVLSFNAGIMHQKIVNMVTKNNNVPNYPLPVRTLGECMCVPFGKILRGMAVPNTVTKTLHTEKMFSPTLDSFTIEEYPMYASIEDQIRTIKSFNRPVILVDDLLHKGYRIKALDPIFKENGLEIRKMITGLLSGHGRDLMTIQGRDVESAYFIPNLKAWFVESTLCPFIGGDGVRSEEKTEAGLIPSINLILPFAAPKFLHDASREAVFELSRVSLENAAKIFRVLEDEYQTVFERKLTIKRLSDAIISPRMPNGSNRVAVDFNLSPSVYMEDYMERLLRLESALK